MRDFVTGACCDGTARVDDNSRLENSFNLLICRYNALDSRMATCVIWRRSRGIDTLALHSFWYIYIYTFQIRMSVIVGFWFHLQQGEEKDCTHGVAPILQVGVVRVYIHFIHCSAIYRHARYRSCLYGVIAVFPASAISKGHLPLAGNLS